MPVPGMQAGRSDLGHGVMTDRMVVDQRQWEREQMMQVGLVCACGRVRARVCAASCSVRVCLSHAISRTCLLPPLASLGVGFPFLPGDADCCCLPYTHSGVSLPPPPLSLSLSPIVSASPLALHGECQEYHWRMMQQGGGMGMPGPLRAQAQHLSRSAAMGGPDFSRQHPSAAAAHVHGQGPGLPLDGPHLDIAQQTQMESMRNMAGTQGALQQMVGIGMQAAPGHPPQDADMSAHMFRHLGGSRAWEPGMGGRGVRVLGRRTPMSVVASEGVMAPLGALGAGGGTRGPAARPEAAASAASLRERAMHEVRPNLLFLSLSCSHALVLHYHVWAYQVRCVLYLWQARVQLELEGVLPPEGAWGTNGSGETGMGHSLCSASIGAGMDARYRARDCTQRGGRGSSRPPESDDPGAGDAGTKRKVGRGGSAGAAAKRQAIAAGDRANIGCVGDGDAAEAGQGPAAIGVAGLVSEDVWASQFFAGEEAVGLAAAAAAGRARIVGDVSTRNAGGDMGFLTESKGKEEEDGGPPCSLVSVSAAGDAANS